MNVMIHACPDRMWYVRRFLLPQLLEQGVEDVAIWNDTKRRGNLGAFLASVEALHGDGTWHIQDDVLLSRDFARRAAEYDLGVVNAFCCLSSGDDPALAGIVYPPDLWHGFPCVRIPDDYARDFAAWVETGQHSPEADAMIQIGKGDDYLFHEYFETVHGTETARNLAPNLVEHVDWLIGGSIANEWRGTPARSALWTEHGLVDQLSRELKAISR